jgi:tRNA(His) guanylyltransferase
MVTAAEKTAKEMQGFKLAYIQSDECTFMITDFDTHDTEGWFNYELNKIVSLSASYFTFYFNQYMGVDEVAVFDSRAFVVPEDDWPNVFVWRQRDWERNSLQMLARSHYSHKECEFKNSDNLHEMLHEKGINWASLKPIYKNGTFITRDYEQLHEKLTYDNLVGLVSLRESQE